MMEFNPNPSGESRFLNRWKSLLPTTQQIRNVTLLTAAIFCSAAADAKVIYVNADVATPGNGTAWSRAFAFLQDALEVAKSGDSIYLAKGTYYPDDGVVDGFGDREISFVLNGLKLYGGFAGGESSLSERDPEANPTILSGEIWPVTPETQGYERYWSLHVVVLKASSTLDGLTIAKGRANGDDAPYSQGGGVYAPSGTALTAKNCIFDTNLANESGGAVWGKVVATKCVFSNNIVNNDQLLSSGPDRLPSWLFNPDGSGGAIKGDVTATNCQFLNNSLEIVCLDLGTHSSATGGAIAGDTINVTGCRFDGNSVTSASFNFAQTGSDATSRGGAISGASVTATDCTFTSNEANSSATSYTSPDPKAIGHYSANPTSIGGAIAGQVTVVNCSFDKNITSTLAGYPPVIPPVPDGDETRTVCSGSSLYVEGTSSIVNSTFTENSCGSVNTTLSRGGYVITRGAVHVADGAFLPVSDSTFYNNMTTGFGAAISCDGSVNTLSNIIWFSDDTVVGFKKTGLIHIAGKARISNRLYPTPSTETINLLKGIRTTAITKGLGANVDFGEPPERTLLNLDPMFVDETDAVGPDGKWRTADDGLRLTVGSPATAKGKTLFLPKDTADLDGDSNYAEAIPTDAAGFARIQDSTLDLGAYELGDNLYTPDIAVEQPAGTPLVDGTASVDFSATQGVPTSFLIRNTGAADLRNLTVAIDGADASSFKFTQPPSKLLVEGATTTFTVNFLPKVSGPKVAVLHIVSNDPDESPFDINLSGDALLPEIAVKNPGGTDLIDGSSTVGFGTIDESDTLTKTFTISNSGIGSLVIQGISSTGTNAASFIVGAPVLSTVPPGGTTTFDVTFSPAGVGNRVGAIVIASNDPDAESSFLFNVKGTGLGAPEIFVSQPFSSELVTGTTNDFGSVKIGSRYSKTFVIKNTGTDVLKNLAVSLSGSATYSKTDLTVTKLNPGEKTSFSVTFKPGSTGKKSATLEIASNDATEPTITLSLVGVGITSSAPASASGLLASASLSGASSVADTSSTAVTTVAKDSDGLKYLVLTVEKSSTWALEKHRVEVSSNLVDWFSGSNHTTTLSDNANVLEVRDNTPVNAGEKRYIRLK
ncbi:MAG: choice-of-anchor D domain-containing protein [Luteolibacter sp.]|uniref:choice-of-anchor D domain-containing protein n=1 Tax=Luteolibacter sp. TaxID=1962973 RepID=UPI003264B27B